MNRDAKLSIIDLSEFTDGSIARKKEIAQQVVHACETHGFFNLVEFGFDPQIFVQARKTALEFFRGDAARKEEVHISRVPHHRGYIGNYDVAPDTKKGGDLREAYKVALELDDQDPDYLAGISLYGPNVWPSGMPEFRETIYGVYEHFQSLSKTIFSLFAIGLDLPENYFGKLTIKPASVMNVNYYPATDPDQRDQTSGIGAHSDYEAFAMLWQDDAGGLEIESLQGEWQTVQPIENALVINIGDLMSRWTNDRFRATRHRVINTSGKERVSFACFGNTNYHAMIECIPSCCTPQTPAKYPPVKSGDYLMQAIARTYAYTTSPVSTTQHPPY